MDNEIVIIREKMMMGPKWFKFFCLWNHFHEQYYAIQKILSWNECQPPPPSLRHLALLSTTFYIYFMENWGALKINNY